MAARNPRAVVGNGSVNREETSTMTYSVRRVARGTVTITDGYGNNGREEPGTEAQIYEDGRFVTSVSLNALTLCLPGGGVYGLDATDDQIIRAILGDEDIFTGAPAFPGHHDKATRGKGRR
jgi:hypothetical protein